MRPVAMMTPDLAMIAEVMLAAEGFREARILAKKTVTLYSLMIQQLSKQVRLLLRLPTRVHLLAYPNNSRLVGLQRMTPLIP